MVALLWLGWFPDLRQPNANYLRALAAALLAGALGAGKVAARVATGERRRSPRREMLSDVELGLLLLTATYVFLSVLGGTASPIYPLSYALVSFLVTFHPLRTGVLLAAAALGFEAVMAFGRGAAPGSAAAFPGHVGFIAVFAILNVAFLHAEVARQRREHRKRLDNEIRSMREEARDFRLISPGLNADSKLRSRAEQEEKLSQGSIETIRQQVFHTVDLLRRSLALKTCALLWLDQAGEKLKLKELSTSATNVTEGALSARSACWGRCSRRAGLARWSPPAQPYCPTTKAQSRSRPSSGYPSSKARPRGLLWATGLPAQPLLLPTSICSCQRQIRFFASYNPSGYFRRSNARSTSTSVLPGLGGTQPCPHPRRSLCRGHRRRPRRMRLRLRRHRGLRRPHWSPLCLPGRRRGERGARGQEPPRSRLHRRHGGEE